ncbi:MAG: [protein-PII] uridylyltransferase [Proteobacteria bacterium]|nr:[protein-PII] uridylyltransferase [Pseudomonadota bacterium]
MMALKFLVYAMKSDNYALKLSIKEFKNELCLEFENQANTQHLIHKLVQFIDEILITLFHQNNLQENNSFCLLALGGYGRRELVLHSDIDLLLLHQPDISDSEVNKAETFIQNCWDIGLPVSHQITTTDNCRDLAAKDLTVISSILDMHHLCGSGALMEELRYQTKPLHIWQSHDFFFAKVKEQEQRYNKYGETAYNLEPNVKYGPGGLRDLQIILAIAKRHFNIKKLADGIGVGFITDKEYEEFINCQHFLLRIRFALHKLADKAEERLVFDYQTKLANLFGFKDSDKSLAIEQFMKVYFKIIKRSRELNEMLLQYFLEDIVHEQKQSIKPLNASFQLANHYIEVKHPKIFSQKNETLLELFLWLAKMPVIRGVRASTIRLIRENLHFINKQFRQSKKAREIFIDLFQTNNLYEALLHMNRYGVLGHYLDSFAHVTGQMQYDLFHVYTVDQHSLFVIRNIERFTDSQYHTEFPLAAKLIEKIKKRNILYLAALFHDIAKGRGGDHSILGAKEAAHFAATHYLDEEDTKLLVWLVENHLLMSKTAQQQDIYSSQTIEQFCAKLPQKTYLNYLYLLTVADICATNPKLWNAWKDSLLKELYKAAFAFMTEKNLLNEEELLINRQNEAQLILEKEGLDKKSMMELWSHFPNKYFLHEPANVIARHSKAILFSEEYPVVLIMPHHSQGGTEVFIYMPHQDARFAITTTVLSNNYATIQEANILTTNNHFDLDSYVILNEKHEAFFDKQSIVQIEKDLIKYLKSSPLPSIIKRRESLREAHFNLTTSISFKDNKNEPFSRLFLISKDRFGLLATISQIFLKQKIHLHHAKIVTAGERAEDMFIITNAKGKALTEKEKKRLKDNLIYDLDN